MLHAEDCINVTSKLLGKIRRANLLSGANTEEISSGIYFDDTGDIGNKLVN